jgi:hypothetical protein
MLENASKIIYQSTGLIVEQDFARNVILCLSIFLVVLFIIFIAYVIQGPEGKIKFTKLFNLIFALVMAIFLFWFAVFISLTSDKPPTGLTNSSLDPIIALIVWIGVLINPRFTINFFPIILTGKERFFIRDEAIKWWRICAVYVIVLFLIVFFISIKRFGFVLL